MLDPKPLDLPEFPPRTTKVSPLSPSGPPPAMEVDVNLDVLPSRSRTVFNAVLGVLGTCAGFLALYEIADLKSHRDQLRIDEFSLEQKNSGLASVNEGLSSQVLELLDRNHKLANALAAADCRYDIERYGSDRIAEMKCDDIKEALPPIQEKLGKCASVLSAQEHAKLKQVTASVAAKALKCNKKGRKP